MSWVGKIAGGAIGFALGGPLGALGGAAVGAFFDVDEMEKRKYETNCPNCNAKIGIDGPGNWTCPNCSNTFYVGDDGGVNNQVKTVFFISTFAMLGKMAKADGKVCENEARVIREFMLNELNLDADDRKAALQIINDAKSSEHVFDEFALQFYEIFKNESQHLYLMLDLLFKVAMADGILHPNEELLLKTAAQIFNIPDNDYQNCKSQYVVDFMKYYNILDCRADDNDEEIRRSFKRKISEYHPDKIISKNLPEEFMELSKRKTEEIIEAYKMIKEKRGISY